MASNVDAHTLYTQTRTRLKTQKFWHLRILRRQCSQLGNITDADAHWENICSKFILQKISWTRLNNILW